MASREERIQQLKEEIGAYLRQIREAHEETQLKVAERLQSGNDETTKTLVSKLEGGKYNATLEAFLELLLFGYEIDFAEFCRHWVAADKNRESEERAARQLLEKALRGGRDVRRKTIDVLKIAIRESAPTPKGKPGK